MFYSVDILRSRKSRKGRLPFCWLASINRPECNSSSKKKNQPANFVGAGLLKVSKKDVEQVDVSAACEDIIEGLTGQENKPRFSLYLAAHLSYGLVRIYKEQVRCLEEETENLLADLMGSGENKKAGGTSGKKNRKQNNREVTSLEVNDNDVPFEFDEYQLFPENRSDQHQIIEEEPIPRNDDFALPLDFGDFGDLCEAIISGSDIRSGPACLLGSIGDEIDQESQSQTQSKNQMHGEALEENLINHEQAQFPDLPNGHEENTVAQLENAQMNYGAQNDFEPPVENMDIDPESANVPIESNQLQDTRSPRAIMAPPENFITPKRKSRRPHDETPTKRTRTVSDYSAPDMAPDMERDRRASTLSESSPVPRPTPRRSLFPNEGGEASVGDVNPDLATTPQAANENLVLSIAGPANETITEQNQYYNEPQHDQPNLALESDESDGQSPGPFDLAPQNLDAVPKKRRRSKKAQSNIIDEVKQISLVNNPTIQTRTKKSTLPKVGGKVPANNLLAVPATGMRIDPFSSKVTRNWGTRLIDCFNNHIKDVCNVPLSEPRQSPRDVSMRNLPRITPSRVRRSRSSSTGMPNPPTPTRPSEKLTDIPTQSGIEHSNVEQHENDALDDAALMPPPSDTLQESPSVPMPVHDRSPAQMRPRSLPSTPHRQIQLADTAPEVDYSTPTRRRAESSERMPAPSPAQIRPGSLPSPHQQVQLADTAPETDDTFLPRRREEESSGHMNSPIPDSESPRGVNSMMTRQEFYEFLKSLWSEYAEYNQINNATRRLELDDALPPSKTSVQELIIYFMYCCDLEMNYRLVLKQDVPYEGVSIIEPEEERKSSDTSEYASSHTSSRSSSSN